LSMHLPQSVLPNVAGGGVGAGVGSEVALGALGASAEDAAAADSAGAGVSEPVGSAELEDAVFSSAGLSGGLDPPPHASQASGAATVRTRMAMGRLWARLMVFDCVARSGAESKHEESLGHERSVRAAPSSPLCLEIQGVTVTVSACR